MHITGVILASMIADGCTSSMFNCLFTNWNAGSLKTSSSPRIVDCCVWLIKINQRQLLTFLLYGWRSTDGNGVVIRQGRTIFVVNPSSRSYSRSRYCARVRTRVAFVFASLIAIESSKLRNAIAACNLQGQRVPYVFLILRCGSIRPSFRASNKIDRKYQRVNKTRWIVSSRRWHACAYLVWFDRRTFYVNVVVYELQVRVGGHNVGHIKTSSATGWLLCVPTCIYAPSFGKVVRAANVTVRINLSKQIAGTPSFWLLKLCGSIPFGFYPGSHFYAFTRLTLL